MKVLINQQVIAFGLNMVSRAINPNNTLPILNNILLEAKEGKLHFSSTNLEIAIKLSVDAKVMQEGSLTIPAKLISNYVNLLPNEELELEMLEDLSLEIKSTKSDTKIKGLKADDYPTIPEIKEEKSFKINAKALEKAINETVFASSLNSSRPILSGIYFSVEKDKVTFVATDSHRLAEKIIKLPTSYEEGFSCIVPAKTMQELAKILNNFEKDEVSISVSKNQILFVVDNIYLTSRLIEGNFPDYKKIIPTESKTSITVKTSDISLALKRIILFAREVNNSIHLEFDPQNKQVTISTDETRIGEEKTKLDIEITGELNKISLNSQYMIDVLAVRDGENIVIELNEKHSPVKIRPEKSDDYIYIIMPLKV
jgi:DNA polymerase-3 subunit beta